jgi:hypothetical protein
LIQAPNIADEQQTLPAMVDAAIAEQMHRVLPRPQR